MGKTVIEEMIVQFGLNPEPYKKNAAEAEKAQKKFKDSVKKNNTELSSSLVEVGRQVALLFIGFESLKAGLSYFGGLNVATANLGRFSANVGLSTHEVNGWGNAVELAGGSAQDAQGDLRNLSQSITALKASGDVSPLVLLFQRMGVALTDSKGKARDLVALYKDLGDRLGQYNRADAANLARQAGLSEGTINLLLTEKGARDALFAAAERNNKLNDDAVKKAQDLQQAWRNIRQEVTGYAQTLESAVTPAVQGTLKWIKDLWASASDSKVFGDVLKGIGVAIKLIWDTGRLAVKGLGELFNLFENSRVGKFIINSFDKIANAFSKGLGNVDQFERNAGGLNDSGNAAPAPVSVSSGVRNNNPGNLKFAGQAGAIGKDARGFAIFGTLADGIKAANAQLNLYSARGINTIRGIASTYAPAGDGNDVPAYMKALQKSTGRGPDDTLTPGDRQKLLQGIFDHEAAGNVQGSAIASILNGDPGALASARFSSAATAPSGGNTTNKHATTSVQIDSITVNTQATDASGIAATLPAAIQRKGIVAQADSGMS